MWGWRVTSPRPGTTPTARELRALEAWLRHDSAKLAGAEMGITEQAVRRHVSNVRIRTGAARRGDLAKLLRPVRRARQPEPETLPLPL